MSGYKATGAAYDRGREAGFAAGYEAGKQAPEYEYGALLRVGVPVPVKAFESRTAAESAIEFWGGVLYRRPVDEWEVVPDGE